MTLLTHDGHATFSLIAQRLRGIREGVTAHWRDGKPRFFIFTPEDSDYLARQDAFGPEVASRFPSAAFDIAEAGNCIAVGRYNAAIYHSVCAAEVGLRCLVLDRRAMDAQKLAKATIGDMLAAIKAKVDHIENRSEPWNSADQIIINEAQAFYSKSLHCACFLNRGWRIPLMHGRASKASRAEAVHSFEATRLFLTDLATRTGEGIVTDEVWKS